MREKTTRKHRRKTTKPRLRQKRPGRYSGKVTPQQRDELIAQLLERDGKFCWYCGLSLRDDITLEHLIPKSQQGGNSLDNIVLAHWFCNNKAGTRPLAAKLKMKEAYAKLFAQVHVPRHLPTVRVGNMVYYIDEDRVVIDE